MKIIFKLIYQSLSLFGRNFKVKWFPKNSCKVNENLDK